jgi:hypothetical protein
MELQVVLISTKEFAFTSQIVMLLVDLILTVAVRTMVQLSSVASFKVVMMTVQSVLGL